MSAPQIANVNAAGSMHHQVLRRFPCWEGTVPDGFIVNFLGVITRTSYWHLYNAVSDGYPADRYVKTTHPSFDEEYFEWIDLLEAVASAKGRFTMLELGSGWGRWTANAAFALKHAGNLPRTLIAVEAEPTHFEWMVQHFADNSVDPNDLRLIQAAVARSDGKVGFHVGETPYGGPASWYGHSIGGPAIVEAVSLRTLLQPLETVDLIDLDIQGAEFEVLESAADALDQKVKRVHIETHSRTIDEALRSLFGRLGWRCLHSYPCGATVDTEWGPIYFQGGVQSWLNPAFFTGSQGQVAALEEKLQSSRREGARLWGELQKLQEERHRLFVRNRPLALKLLDTVRWLRDRMAPAGTRRRRMSDALTRKLPLGARLGERNDF